MKKITKKSAMEMLNGEVKLVGSYWNFNATTIEGAIESAKDLKGLINSLDIRSCCKQTNNQIIFLKQNKEKTYLNTIGYTWYETIIDDFKFILLENDSCTICYNIVK